MTRVLLAVGFRQRQAPPVEPVTLTELPPTSVGGDADAADQTHVAASYDREHGHPKR